MNAFGLTANDKRLMNFTFVVRRLLFYHHSYHIFFLLNYRKNRPLFTIYHLPFFIFEDEKFVLTYHIIFICNF